MSERDSLYRQQVLPVAQEAGSVLQRSLPLLLASLVAALLFITLAILLFTTRYKETEQARGVLESLGPTQEVTAPTSGRIAEWHVQEGDEVVRGQSLATLTRSVFDGNGVPLSRVLKEELQASHSLVSAEIAMTQKHFDDQQEQLRQHLRDKESSLQLLHSEWQLSMEQHEIGERQLAALRVLMHNSAATSRAEIDRQQLSLLGLQRQEQAAQRQLQEQQSEVATLQNQLATLALKGELALLPLRKQALLLEQEIRRAAREETFVVVAEQAGTLAAIAVSAGQSAGAGQLLARIEQQGGEVEAVVYVPSRVAGKLAPGQEVLLSFDAFDFHQYGRYPARIKHISKASIDPRTQILPVPGLNEPVFRLTATLEQSWVEGPASYTLQAGLFFTADFVLEELSLLHFIFKPVLALRGRIS